jgi:hypothetical protein
VNGILRDAVRTLCLRLAFEAGMPQHGISLLFPAFCTDPFRLTYLVPTLGSASKLPKTCRWSSSEVRFRYGGFDAHLRSSDHHAGSASCAFMDTVPAPIPSPIFSIATNTWGDKKFKLKNRYHQLNDEDLLFREGGEQALSERLQARLNMSAAEVNALITRL